MTDNSKVMCIQPALRVHSYPLCLTRHHQVLRMVSLPSCHTSLTPASWEAQHFKSDISKKFTTQVEWFLKKTMVILLFIGNEHR